MKISEHAIKISVATLVGGVITVAAAVGFSTPKQKFEEHERRFVVVETRQEKVEQRQIESDKTLVRMDQKLDDLIDGLGVPRHRAGRRGN